MIHVFRKLRRKLAAEGKTFGYLKYAIGEILLVVIGILLALQLNNWNAEIADKRESRRFMERLLVEVESNLQASALEIGKKRAQLSGLSAILEMISNPAARSSQQTLDSLIYIVITSSTIDIQTGTLSEGLNNGKIALIGSDSLRVALYGFPAVLEAARAFEKLNNDDTNTSYGKFLYDHFNYRRMDATFSPYKEQIGKSAFPPDNFGLLTTLKFENLTDNRLFLTNRQFEIYSNLQEKLKRIRSLIQRELAREK
jgi:hypothetical protein